MMKKRALKGPLTGILIIATGMVLCGIAAFTTATGNGGEKPPNVILILADDMAYGDISRVNGGLTQTPNLDDLIGEGVWFSSAYSASPVCAPARASLLTGLYPHRTGCVTLGNQRFPDLTRLYPGIQTIADLFSENNYRTGLIGKWHCGEGSGYHPMDRGFQEFEGFIGYMVESYYNYKLDINGNIREFKDRYLTDELTDRAIDFIKRHSREPFFLHLAYYAPHRPLGAPRELVEKYQEKGFEENTATIYAMIEVMDSGIGRIEAALDDLGIRENTLIIFTSDNGPDPIPGKRANEGLKGSKYTVNEGGIHVPLIFNWKEELEPFTVGEPVHFTDMFPTLVGMCNLETEENMVLDGCDISGLLDSNAPGKTIYARYWQWNRGVPMYTHNAAVRQGKFKLVRPFVTRGIPDGESDLPYRLYDLENDPGETTDVSDANRQTGENLNVLLEEWCREVEFDRLKNRN